MTELSEQNGVSFCEQEGGFSSEVLHNLLKRNTRSKCMSSAQAIPTKMTMTVEQRAEQCYSHCVCFCQNESYHTCIYFFSCVYYPLATALEGI